MLTHLTIRSPIMTDVVWCNPDMWYHLNVIRHHDGCRLVHPAEWDIGQFWGAFVTDADWCIPSGGSFGISIQFIIHIHSIFKYRISVPYSHFVLTFQRYTQSMYLFHVLIHIFISYTHSCIYFIYSFMYSFHSYLVTYQNT